MPKREKLETANTAPPSGRKAEEIARSDATRSASPDYDHPAKAERAIYGRRSSFWNLLVGLWDRKESPRKAWWWNHVRYLQKGSILLCFDIRRKIEASAPSTRALAYHSISQTSRLSTDEHEGQFKGNRLSPTDNGHVDVVIKLYSQSEDSTAG